MYMDIVHICVSYKTISLAAFSQFNRGRRPRLIKVRVASVHFSKWRLPWNNEIGIYLLKSYFKLSLKPSEICATQK